MILLGIVTLINLGVLILMVAQVRDLTVEVHQTKKDVIALADREHTHHNELEVEDMHIYEKLAQIGRIFVDMSNKYTLLKKDVATLSKKSVFSYEQNMDAFKEADENAGDV